ncbi:MAG: hypothetical protein GXP40_04090, partial [Chloroflexi bacterium]|nr:hypothetical protein [Chloroflexota bacterium]
MKKWKWVEIILIVAVLSAHSYAAFSNTQNFPNRWFTRDDAYYYFKVAQNISEGHGITFDGINRANGYHPLWMAVCIPIFALARFDLVLPLRILLLVMAALSAATGVMLFRLISRVLSKPVGVLAAAFWVFNTYIHATVTQFGMETGITAFALVLLLYLLEDFERKWRTEAVTLKQIAGLGLAATFLLFSRLDTVFLLAIIGLWIVFRSTPIRYYLPLDILGIVAAVLASFTLRLGLHAYYEYASTALWMLALALAVKIPVYYFSGLYQRPRAFPDKRLAIRLILAVSAASALVAALMLGLNRVGLFGGFPRSTLFIEWGLSLLFAAATRLGFQHLAPQRAAKSPVVVPVVLIKDNWQRWLSESAVYYGIWGGALAVYMLWSKIVFGTTSPVSGQIKRWWGSLPGNAYGGPARRIHTFFGVDTT